MVKNFIILRRETCDACDKLKITLGVKICSECGCSIWAKSMLKDATCPLNKWDIYDKDDRSSTHGSS